MVPFRIRDRSFSVQESIMADTFSSRLVPHALGPAKQPRFTRENIAAELSNSLPNKHGLFKALGGQVNSLFTTNLKADLYTDTTQYFGRKDLEKIIARNNLTDIAWLSRGLELKRSICRVVTPSGLGTGFIINGDYLITNNHVIDSIASAEDTIVEFNYELGWDKTPQKVTSFKLDPSRFKTNSELDYTAVRVSGNPTREFGSIDLRNRATAKESDYVTIIQHPSGSYKQIALTDNKVFRVFSHFVQYVTDTEPGSSGSPVFDQGWRIVALHHKGGNLSGPDGKSAYVNQGVSIEAIINDAASIIAISDEIFDAAIGPLRPTLEWLCGTSGSKDAVRTAASIVSITDSGFASILDSRVGGDSELGPLGAAILGTATGAVIRHIGKHNESASSDESTIELSEGLVNKLNNDIKSYRESDISPWELYKEIIEKASQVPDEYRVLSDHATSLEAFPVVVAVYLAGVVAGARAYDGKL